MGNILIKDCIVLPMCESGGKRYFYGSLGIEGNMIALVDETGEGVEAFRRKHAGDLCEIDGRGRLAMPGLINSHCHTSMTLLRSYADDLPLMPWLHEYVWPFEAKMNDDDVRVGAELGIAEMLLGGTTTFLDMYFSQRVVGEVAERMGMRAVLSPVVRDTNKDKFEKDIAAVTERYADHSHPRITFMIAAHSPYTCSRETLLYARDLAAKWGVGVNIHVAETQDEVDILSAKEGMTPVGYLDSLGLLNSSTVAVHCVHLTDEDIEIFRKRGVSVSHNPQSNMKLASGVSPVARMAAAGINVAVGTDGPSSNNDLDMWEEMRSASFLQKVSTSDPCAMTAWDTLRAATVGGARALGLDDMVGQLRVGMLADVILLDVEKPHLYPQTDMVANLVYCGKAADVDTVIVDGRIVVEGGRMPGFDVMKSARAAEKLIKEIKAR